MKKIIVIALAALAAIALTAFVSASDSLSSEGKVSLESTATPALNCTLSIGNAEALYRLVPGYKIVASDVTWAELDQLFLGQENN